MFAFFYDHSFIVFKFIRVIGKDKSDEFHLYFENKNLKRKYFETSLSGYEYYILVLQIVKLADKRYS